jgi:hypothetical chaperone protein
MGVACGIDFGTSNTAVSLAIDGEVRPVDLDPAAAIARTIPTLLYFPAEGAPSFGTRAIHDYLARDLTGRLIAYLAVCRAAVEREAGRAVDTVVMGRPAVFHVLPERDALAQARLEAAARLAGFAEVGFQLEPIAAARAFERGLDRDVLCLIGDLGCGTSDFTVIRLGPGRVGRRDRAADVYGSAGTDVGGNDVDARLIHAWVLPHFGYGSHWRPLRRRVPFPTALHLAATRWHRLCVEASDPANLRFLDRAVCSADDPAGLARFREFLYRNDGYSLFRAVERTKVALSTQDQAPLRFLEGLADIDELVSRAALEAAIAEELARLERCLDGLLGRLGLAPEAMECVFLTGGTCRIPAVRALFDLRFPGRILERDAFTAVGLGLGVEAAERYT